MPSPLRICYPGAIYHLVSRGNDKKDIFWDDMDRRCYLDLLYTTISDCKLQVYSYALMSNHVHLFLKTVLPNISEVMYKLNRNYALYFNRRYAKSDHLFGGTFKSKLVQKERYFLALLRYIHMNPVSAGIVSAPEEYEWSSHRAYLSGTDRIIAETAEVFSLFSQDPDRAKAAYLEFLAKPIPEKEKAILSKERNGILGDLSFRNSLKGSRNLL